MTGVALAAVAALAVTALSFTALLRSMIRQQAREREMLLNQVMHLAGRTWQPPPAEEWRPPDVAPEPDRYVSSASEFSENF